MRPDFFKRRDVWIAAAVQVTLSIFLAQGYDFRVEYIAGRNVANGTSPYSGGMVSGWMALGYGAQVQGIGETPLWAIYMGVCYFLSSGQPILFNFLTKIPIVAANLALAYFAYSREVRGWRFFLFNIFLILVSVTWGKPDNLACLLAVLALVASNSAIGSASLLSTSLMIKPLGIAILPAFFLRVRKMSVRWGVLFIAEVLLFSTGMFLAPFIAYGWPLREVVYGFPTWFNHAGALSPFNLMSIETGTEQLPSSLWWIGYSVLLSTCVLTVYAILRKPQNTLRYALFSAVVFFTLRPWNSEQNLVMILILFILICGQLPSRWLWFVPLMFAFANNAVQQQLYLLMPTIVDRLNILYFPFTTYRLWLKFLLSIVWLIVLWFNFTTLYRREDRSCSRASSALKNHRQR